MPRESGKVKVIVATGVGITEAIKAALPLSISDFAERYQLARTAVSMCIHGRQRHERVREALARELNVDRAWLDEQLDALMAKRRAA